MLVRGVIIMRLVASAAASHQAKSSVWRGVRLYGGGVFGGEARGAAHNKKRVTHHGYQIFFAMSCRPRQCHGDM